MNKIAVKAISICLSAAMLGSSFVPSTVSDLKVSDSIVYAATSKVGTNLIETPDCSSTKGYGLYLAGGAVATMTSSNGALDVSIQAPNSLFFP